MRGIRNSFRIGGPGFNAFFIFLVVVVVVVGVSLTVFNWGWLQGEIDPPESNSTTLRNVGLLIGGVVALIFALWRSIVAGHEADTTRGQMKETQNQVKLTQDQISVAQQQADAAQKQADLAQQGLLNERYQKGAEMLGSDVLSVRLGGIYALRYLAEEHPEQYHIQAMRLLCPFVRNPTKDDVYHPDGDSKVRGDVQIALESICACHEINTVRGGETQFWLDFRGADLRGAQLEDVDLSVESPLDEETDADIFNAHRFGADFAQAQLQSARMSRAKFPRANFTEANLSGADLVTVNLSGATLWNANLSSATLWDANLSDAMLRGADLSSATLWDANLSDAILWGADLSDAKLRGANLSNTDLSSADLSGVRDLTQDQLDQAVADPLNPPHLGGITEAETGKPLIWRGKPLYD